MEPYDRLIGFTQNLQGIKNLSPEFLITLTYEPSQLPVKLLSTHSIIEKPSVTPINLESIPENNSFIPSSGTKPESSF